MTLTAPSVLIVDDHLDTCRALVRLIRMFKFEAVCRESGPEALAYLQTTLPDLMIVDVMMPGMSGLDVVRAVRSRLETRDVPIIMYSAVTDPETAAKARALGVQDFVIKGRITFNELRVQLEKHIKRSDA